VVSWVLNDKKNPVKSALICVLLLEGGVASCLGAFVANQIDSSNLS
jgi:hypothetical protein